MTTCVQAIQNQIAAGTVMNLPQIYPNTATAVTVTQTQPALFLLESTQSQNAVISLVGQSGLGAGNPVNLTLTIYSYIGNTATALGSINIVTPSTSFTQAFTSGNYLICIASNNPGGYTGTLTGQFAGFPAIARFAATFSAGESLNAVLYQPPPPPPTCNQPIWFEFVQGELPPNITLLQNGVLEGVFPNLDCITDAPYSPAVNWFYNPGDAINPVGRQWRFQVKCWLQNFPDVIDLRWFCIRVYNDWSLDRDNFLAQPKQKDVSITKVNKPAPLPLVCVPCENVEPVPSFESLPVLCPTCEPEPGTTITATTIKSPPVVNVRGPNDLDTLFLEWGNIINQENPIFTQALQGEFMEVTLDTHPTA